MSIFLAALLRPVFLMLVYGLARCITTGVRALFK